MVDSRYGLIGNAVDFPSSMSEPLPRAAASPDVDRHLEAVVEPSREGAFPAVDFSLPSFSGENRMIAVILGFSSVTAIVLIGIAFATVSLGSKLLSVFS